MLFPKNLSGFWVLVYLFIKITNVQGVYFESSGYNIFFNDIESTKNSLTSPGLAIAICNNTKYEEGEILCILVRETVKYDNVQDHLQVCYLNASLDDKIYRKKTDALDNNKAVMFVEHSGSVTLLIIDLSNCQFVTSKLYKFFVDFASVRNVNGKFFDILYKDQFSQNHRKWTLDINGTIVTAPKGEFLNYFKEGAYLYSPTEGRLVFGRPNATSGMGLYSMNDNGSVKLIKEYPNYFFRDEASSSMSSYGFLTACFVDKNNSDACIQYDSNAMLKFETILKPRGILSFLEKIQNLPDGGLLFVIDACIGVDYRNRSGLDECRKHYLLKKISSTGQESEQLKIPRLKCEAPTDFYVQRFFQKENGDFCLSLICGYNEFFLVKFILTCFKDEEFQNVTHRLT